MHGASNRDTHLYPPHNSSVHLTTTYVRRTGWITNGMRSGRTTPQESVFSSPTPATTRSASQKEPGSGLTVSALVSGMKLWSLVGLSARPEFQWWSTHCATSMLLLSDELMSCCAVGTNVCCDLRRRAFALNGRVSAEWSRCPGPMARHARDSLASLQRRSADWMPTSIGRLSADVGRRHPDTIRKASLMAGSWGRCEHCSTRQARSTLQLNRPGLEWVFTERLQKHPNQNQ